MFENKTLYCRAVKLFKSAAQKGSIPAATVLAKRYETGSGIKRDYAEALRWYKLSGTEYESLVIYPFR